MLCLPKRGCPIEVALLIVVIAGLMTVWMLLGDEYVNDFRGIPNPTDKTPELPQPPQPSQPPQESVEEAQDTYASDGLLETHPRAVIIETEMTPNLIPLMLHFSTVLGPTWTVLLFTLEEHWEEPKSPAWKRAVAAKQFEIRFLPADTQLKDSGSVSRFLTKPWLWQQLEPARRILMFQSDSIICSKATTTVEDFFGYDFVGAPIDGVYGHGYNGGLSLRNPSLFLKITQEASFENSSAEFEDQWFYEEIKARDSQLPDVDVAKTFSVETIYYDKPLGYHQPARWQKDQMDQIEEWCPEVKMLIGRRAT